MQNLKEFERGFFLVQISTKPNIKTISTLTGFSTATISNALNGKRGVKHETMEKILSVAKEIGYVNQSDTNKLRFIVFRVPGGKFAESPVLASAMQGAEKVCSRHGFEVSVIYLDTNSIHYHQELDGILNDRSHGIVIMGSEAVESEIMKFKESNLPLVLIDYWLDDMDIECVINNGKDSIKRIVDYLIGKGHKEIGYFRAKLRAYPFRERGDALEENLNRHGISLKEKYICDIGWSYESSYESVREWLEGKPGLPTAFFADNDFMAMGAIRAMQEMGIRIPEDVSIVGFDNVAMSDVIIPKLTTIQIEPELLGEIAAEKIISAVKDPFRIKSKVVVATSFVERDSVATPRTYDMKGVLI